MKKINIAIQDSEFEMLKKLGGKQTPMAQMCLENFLYLHRVNVNELKHKFSIGEISAMLDIAKGTLFSPEWASIKKAVIVHTEEAQKYYNIDKKWQIDTNILIDKLENLSSGQILCLQFELFRFWNVEESYHLNTGNFIETFA